jgi:hypothetical protein
MIKSPPEPVRKSFRLAQLRNPLRLLSRLAAADVSYLAEYCARVLADGPAPETRALETLLANWRTIANFAGFARHYVEEFVFHTEDRAKALRRGNGCRRKLRKSLGYSITHDFRL